MATKPLIAVSIVERDKHGEALCTWMYPTLGDLEPVVISRSQMGADQVPGDMLFSKFKVRSERISVLHTHLRVRSITHLGSPGQPQNRTLDRSQPTDPPCGLKLGVQNTWIYCFPAMNTNHSDLPQVSHHNPSACLPARGSPMQTLQAIPCCLLRSASSASTKLLLSC